MITFSKNKYIIPYSGFITLSVGEGYLILSKDDYEDILYVSHTATEIELVDRFGEPCKLLFDALPYSLAALAYLPALLSFEIGDLTLEQLVGCCAVILINKRFSAIVELSADDFSTLRFSEYILKEYQIPWRQFLDTCILSDEFGKPVDTIPNKYVFLSLYPGQGPDMSGMIPQNSDMTPIAKPSHAPRVSKAEWEEFAEDPDMIYIGSGAFMKKTTDKMFEVSDYDDTTDELILQRLKELGRDTNSEDAGTQAESSDSLTAVANPPEEAAEIKRALFNRGG